MLPLGQMIPNKVLPERKADHSFCIAGEIFFKGLYAWPDFEIDTDRILLLQ